MEDDLDDCADLVRAALLQLAQQLQQKGMPDMAIDLALFETFTQRLMDRSEYAEWREILETALDEDWAEQSIH